MDDFILDGQVSRRHAVINSLVAGIAAATAM